MIRRYKDHISKYLKERSITKFLEENRVLRYTINDDLSVDVDGDVDISNNPISYYHNDKSYNTIPCKFNNISGYFDCSHNQLSSFENFPNSVGSDLRADHNSFTSLDGFKTSVGDRLDITHNLIESVTNLNGMNLDNVDLSSNPIKHISSEVINMSNFEDISTFDNTPIYDLLNFFRQMRIGTNIRLQEGIDMEWRAEEKLMTLILERFNEFEVFKDNEVDLHSLNSLYDFYELDFNADKINILFKLERLEYKIYGE